MKNPSEDTVAVENINTSGINTPGKTHQLNAVKYHAVRDAMLRVMTKDASGLTIADIKSTTLTHLPDDMFPSGNKRGQWQKSVQLEFQAKGVIKRAATKPPRFSFLAPSLLFKISRGRRIATGAGPSYCGVNTHTLNRNFGDQYRSPYATRRAV